MGAEGGRGRGMNGAPQKPSFPAEAAAASYKAGNHPS